MISNRVSTHPGEILREEFLKPMKLTVNQFAQMSGIDSIWVWNLISCGNKVTYPIACKLAKALNTSIELWIRLQGKYDLTAELAKIPESGNIPPDETCDQMFTRAIKEAFIETGIDLSLKKSETKQPSPYSE